MIVQGTPDILKPPGGPISGAWGDLGVVPLPDPVYGGSLRQRYAESHDAAARDRILSVWNSDAPDWVIVDKLREINDPNTYQAVGVSFEDFFDWWNIASAQSDIARTYQDDRMTRAQRGQVIRFVIDNTPRLTEAQAAAATGLDVPTFMAWLTQSDEGYANTARTIMALPVKDAQKAQLLKSFAAKNGLSVADLSRYLQQPTGTVSGLLSLAAGTLAYSGGGLVTQATASAPGAALVGNSWVLIPAGSSRIVDAVQAADGSGTIVVTTVEGIEAGILPGASGLRRLPINPQGVGRILALLRSTALDYQAQSIAIYKALIESGVTDEDELESWIPAGVDKVREWLKVQGQTKVPTAEEIGIQAPSFPQDVELNRQFAEVFNDPSRSREEKAAAWVSIMRTNNLGLNDVSRIVGIDARAVSEFLSSTDLAKTAEVFTVIPYTESNVLESETPETLFVPVYTSRATPTGAGGEIPTLVAGLSTMTTQQQAAEYLRLIGLGWTNSQIRLAVTLAYGDQADADWQMLRDVAAAQAQALAAAADAAAKAAADAAVKAAKAAADAAAKAAADAAAKAAADAAAAAKAAADAAAKASADAAAKAAADAAAAAGGGGGIAPLLLAVAAAVILGG